MWRRLRRRMGRIHCWHGTRTLASWHLCRNPIYYTQCHVTPGFENVSMTVKFYLRLDDLLGSPSTAENAKFNNIYGPEKGFETVLLAKVASQGASKWKLLKMAHIHQVRVEMSKILAQRQRKFVQALCFKSISVQICPSFGRAPACHQGGERKCEELKHLRFAADTLSVGNTQVDHW